MKSFCQYCEGAQDYIPELIQKLQSYPDDVFVHFGDVKKVGIYPAARRTVCAGVFAFPKKYVLSQIQRNPYFFNRPHAFIIKPKPGIRILRFQDVTSEWIEEIVKKFNLQKIYDDTAALYNPHVRPADEFFCDMLKVATGWNKGAGAAIVRKAGYDALYDEGGGIMHTNEPYQIVFINPAYTVVERIDLGPNKNRFKTMAYKVLKTLADIMFGPNNYKLNYSARYSERFLTAHGEIDKHPFSLSFKYYAPSGNHEELKGYVSLHSQEASKEYPFPDTYIGISNDKPFTQADIEKVAKDLKEKLSKTTFRDNKDQYIEPIIKEINKVLGFQKAPKIEAENATIEKKYQEGTFRLNMYFSAYGG